VPQLALEENTPTVTISADELRAASAIFRTLGKQALASVIARLESRRIERGQVLREPGCLLLLREGCARREDSEEVDDHSQAEFRPGCVLGEAAVLGLEEASVTCSTVVVAESQCLALVLRRSAFLEALEGHQEDSEAFSRLQLEAFPARIPNAPAHLQLRKSLKSAVVFQNCDYGFLDHLAAQLEDCFLAPGEALPSFGPDGCAAVYFVAAGPVQVEGEDSALLRVAKAGDIIGEALAVGIEGAQDLVARAGPKRVAYCMRLTTTALLGALHIHPEEHLPLEELIREQEMKRIEAAKERYEWIAKMATPAVGRTPLLAGCPEAFLSAVAGYTTEATFAPGDVIVGAGAAAQAMFVVLEGSVDLETRTGAPVGRLGVGGALGDTEALGLFNTCVVTARAAAHCRLLRVTREAVQQALLGPHGKDMRAGFKRLVESRREQVHSGRPLCGLKIGASPDDVTVKTVALQAERVPLESGELWEPVPDDDPCGPRVGVFLAGRAVVELKSGREVMPITAGCILLEGVLSEFGARVRAVSSDCEAYRVRLFDLLAASKYGDKVPDWFYQFRLLENDTTKHLRSKLVNTRGLVNNKSTHLCDPCIRDWAARRKESVRRAEMMRAEKASVLSTGKGSVPQLPLLPPDKFGTTGFRSWDKVPLPPLVYPSSKSRSSGKVLPKGLASYPVLRLPKINSEPNLRGAKEAARRPSRAPPSGRSLSRERGAATAPVTTAIAVDTAVSS